ncbi:MAG: hypothetical protein MK102_15695 [Fuerstiella sp.]|nr:hypothetical protein [Fuerstiella sp.]
MFRSVLLLLAVLSPAASRLAADGPSIDVLRNVQGATGATVARAAFRTLTSVGATNLIPILEGFQGATRVGTNWLRGAFETIAATEIEAGRNLPADELTEFIQDVGNDPSARRLGYEWLLQQDETLKQRIVPDLLQDADPDFRRDAVAMLIDQAETSEGQQATELYRQALKGAVHDDQVKTIAAALESAGEPVDLQTHFGFMPEWKIVGPFDNREMKGYAVAYPPESEFDLTAVYDGQLDTVSWQNIATDDDYGIVNIAEQIENYKGSVMYAVTMFRSAAAQDVQFRLGTPNAWKLWLNGELMFEREEYHRGTQMDQYRVPVSLRSGGNTILLKICQNEDEQGWAQRYQYQLRVSDSAGAAILPSGENHD